MKKLKEKITKNSVRFNFCVSSGATLNVFKQEENMTVNLGRLVWKYSCLENPRDGGAWWAAFYGVAQSRTRLKRLSSRSAAAAYTPIQSKNLKKQMNKQNPNDTMSPLSGEAKKRLVFYVLKHVVCYCVCSLVFWHLWMLQRGTDGARQAISPKDRTEDFPGSHLSHSTRLIHGKQTLAHRCVLIPSTALKSGVEINSIFGIS